MTLDPRTRVSMTPEAKTISGHLLRKEAVEEEDLVVEEALVAGTSLQLEKEPHATASLVAKTLILSRYPTSSRKTVHKF